MGSRGAASGTGKHPYGSEYKTVLQDGNIKFVKVRRGNTTAPMETQTRGRIYVTINAKDEIKFVSFYDSNGKRFKTLDADHKHLINGEWMKPHKHLGYEHNENGDAKLNTAEEKLLEKVRRIWFNRK